MNIRDQQKEKRRAEILLAGLDLFVKKGYASTKTSDIARAAGMSDGLLFHYFATKEKLYEELVRIGMEASDDWMEQNTDRPLDFFLEVTEQILEMIQGNPQGAMFFILMAQAQRNSTTPEGVLKLLAAQKSRFAKTMELITRGQKIGEIRSGEPDALAWAYWCSIQGIAEQLALYPDTPFPRAEWIVGILKNEHERKMEDDQI